MESLLSDYTEDIESFENQGLGIPAVYLFLLQLRFLILTDNIRQLGVIAKSNSWDSRCYLQFRTSELWFNFNGTVSSSVK